MKLFTLLRAALAVFAIILLAFLFFGCSETTHTPEELPPGIGRTLGDVIGGRWAFLDGGSVMDLYEFQPSTSTFCEAHPITGWDTLRCDFNYVVLDGPESDTVYIHLLNGTDRVWVIPFFSEDEITVFPDSGNGFPFVLNRQQ